MENFSLEVTPKMLHFIWLPPDREKNAIPKDVSENLALWKSNHPGYELKIWDMGDTVDLLEKNCRFDIIEAINKCRFEAMKADIIRLAILYFVGGVYSDLKNKPMRPFLEKVLEYRCVVIPEHAPTIEKYKGRIMNSFLAAPPKSPFIQDCLDGIVNTVKKGLGRDVVSTTGAGPLAAVMSRRMDLNEFILLPSPLVWGVSGKDTSGWMTRISSSYNGENMDMHWSRRQKRESLYLD